MRAFLDTEFVQGSDGPQFISAAFITDDGRSLYSEATVAEAEAILLRHPSDFVRAEVLPQFGRVRGVPWCDLPERLSDWLGSLGVETLEVVYDYSADYTLVEQLVARLKVPPVVRLEAIHVGYLLEDQAGCKAAESSWTALEAVVGVGRHHALSDAFALRARFEAVHYVPEKVDWKTIEVEATVTLIIAMFQLVHAETDDGELTLSIGDLAAGLDWRTLGVGDRIRCIVETGPATRVLSAVVLKPMTPLSAIVGARGRLTLPSELRQALRLNTGDKLTFTVQPDGNVLVSIAQPESLKR